MITPDAEWRTRSHWLGADPYEPGPSLEGAARADVVIVGGGFTGLWTAHFLKEADPTLDVAVIEREIVGYGGSGRNGGFAMAVLDYSLHHLVRNFGLERARHAHEAAARSVVGIGEWAEKRGVDCEYELTGLLGIATDQGQVARVRQDLTAADALGLDGWRFLSTSDVRAEIDSPRFVCGFLEETSALLNPAKLVRGIKRVAEEQGVRVFERTPITRLERGRRMRVVTPDGRIESEQVVLALNPWSFQVPMLGRRALPLYTYILLTEPLTEGQLARVGWANRRGWESKRNYLHYVRLTADDRILFGSEAVYHYGPGIGPRFERSPAVFRAMERELRAFFPQLHDVRIADRWGGPIAVTARFVPIFGSIGERLHYGYGYNGHGVAPSHLGGQVLRDLVLGRETELTSLLFVEEQPEFPPEPLAYLGAQATRRALKRQDHRMARGEDAGAFEPWLLRAINRLS